MRKAIWLSGAAAMALTGLGGASALAQTGDDDAVIRDVITVTARKKEENIQEVPVAVTAFSSEDIFEQGIQNIEDISRRTAGFIFDTPFGRQFDRPIIRGQANILGDSGVSVFIDGVNVPQSIRSLNFGDVDRVEIIKGPQSALFGRNTYSGAINITTRQPTNEFDGDLSFEAGADGLYQFLGNVRGPIIEDKLYFSISGRVYEFESEFDVPENQNPSIGNESSRSIAGVIRAYPTENWEITFRGAYNEDDDGHFPVGFLGFEQLNVNVPTAFSDPGVVVPGAVNLGGTQPFFRGVVPPSFPTPSGPVDLAAGTGQLSDTLGPGGGIEREDQFYAINSNLEFGGGYNLFTTIGYTKERFRDELDSDGQLDAFSNALAVSSSTGLLISPAPFIFPGANFFIGFPSDFTTTDDDTQETFVAEARIDSPASERLRWRLGGYFFRSEDRNRDLMGRFQDPDVLAAAEASFDSFVETVVASSGLPSFALINFGGSFEDGFGPTDPRDILTRNVSVFGSVAYDLSDSITFGAELRWASERITADAFDVATGEVIQIDGENDEISQTFDALTPRFTIDWQVTDNNLLYATGARGTKPGGVNVGGSDAARQSIGDSGVVFFGEEGAWQAEIGSKNVFADGQLVLNIAGFYTRLSDYQLTETLAGLGVAVGGGGTTTSVTANVGDARIFGLELEGAFSPAALPGVTVGGTYAWTDTEFTSGTESTQGLVFGDSSIVGQEIPRQARHQASFFADYSRDLSENVNALFSVNGNYLSSRFGQVQNLTESGDAFELDARLTMTLEDRYSLSFYGKNLTNEDAISGVLRFLDASNGNGSAVINGVTQEAFLISGVAQSRGFQYSNRLGARWGVVARVKF